MSPDPTDRPGAAWLRRPGQSGPFGALLDEMARAAEDFCRVVETIPDSAFLEERPGPDPDTVSIRAVCTHVIGCVYGHTNYTRQVRHLPVLTPVPPELRTPGAPAEVRRLLRAGMLYAEEAFEGLNSLPEEAVAAMTFPARWGPTYDPEMMMEHAVVHLLRHRRQIERWTRPAATDRAK